MTSIVLFAEKSTEEATLALHQELEPIEFPEGLTITINNTEGAESGARYEEEQLVELSLAQCYTLEDVVRELVGLLMGRGDEEDAET